MESFAAGLFAILSFAPPKSMAEFLHEISRFWTPHPGQEKFLLSEATTKILACGRRWGKSQALAIQMLYRMVSQPFSRQILIAPTLEQTRISIDAAADFAAKLGLSEAMETKSGRLPSLKIDQSIVMGRSAKQGNSLRGFEATDLILDEAAFIPDTFIERVLMPMMATTGG